VPFVEPVSIRRACIIYNSTVLQCCSKGCRLLGGVDSISVMRFGVAAGLGEHCARIAEEAVVRFDVP